MTLKPTSNQGSGGGGSGTVTSVSSADTSIAVATGTTTPVLQLASLSTIAANEGGTVPVANGGTASTTAAAAAAALSVTPATGWIADANTWTYASGSGGGTATFTIAGLDATGYLTTGTRIKLTQSSTVAYFVVASATFSTNTTVTITGGSDYTLANSAITVNAYSYAANPQGFPGWFNFAAATSGFSSTSSVITRFYVVGRQMTVEHAVTGTSNATTFGFTAPIPSVQGSIYLVRCEDATTIDAAACQLNTAAASTAWLYRLGLGSGSGGFTATGTKASSAIVVVEI